MFSYKIKYTDNFGNVDRRFTEFEAASLQK